MADTKISALTDGTTADATDRIPVARDPTGTPLSRYITPAYINTYLLALAQTWTGAHTFAAGTITSSVTALTITQTWNASGTTFMPMSIDITNTASSSNSRPFRIRVGGSSVFDVSREGNLSIESGAVTAGANGITLNNSRDLAFVGSFVGRVKWSDVGLSRSAAGILNVDNASTGAAALEFREQTAPSAAAANAVRIYAQDNGAGKTQLMAIFATGAAQQIAIEP